jgi:preprotein translocase subunit YajC
MMTTLLLTLAQAPAPAAPPQSALSTLIPFFCIAVIFYFLIIRPQQKRQKEQNALIASVKTGDSVVMNSGIHGIVTNVKDQTLIVKVADNVKIEFDKVAIATVTKASTEG